MPKVVVNSVSQCKNQAFSALRILVEGFASTDGMVAESVEELAKAKDDAISLLLHLHILHFGEARGLLRKDSLATAATWHCQPSNSTSFAELLEFLEMLRANYLPELTGDGALGDGRFELLRQRSLDTPYVYEVLELLRIISGKKGERSKIDYKQISVDFMGDFYESSLEISPRWSIQSRIDEHAASCLPRRRIELQFSPNYRRRCGSFYTPEHVVQKILKSAVGPLCDRIDKRYESDSQTSNLIEDYLELRIVDPSMGSGHFLLGAMNFLLERIRPALNPQDAGNVEYLVELKSKIAQNCLFGVDIDSTAVEIAQVVVWLDVASTTLSAGSLKKNLRHGNSLVGALSATCPDLASSPDWPGLSGILGHRANFERDNPSLSALRMVADAWCSRTAFSAVELEQHRMAQSKDAGDQRRLCAKIDQLAPFHWELEFPWVFFRDAGPGGFDSVIGNPPYGLTRNEVISPEEERFLTSQYKPYISGKPNKFLLFQARAHQIVRRGGSVGFLGPNSWFAIPAGRAMREYILNEQRLAEVDYYLYPVFRSIGVEVASVVSWRDSPSETFRVTRIENPHTEFTPFEVAKKDCRPPEYIISLNRSPQVAELLSRILSVSSTLGTNLERFICRVGLQAYAKGKGIPNQTAAVVETHPFHSNESHGPDWHRYLVGSDISRFSNTWSGEWLHYGEWLAECPAIADYTRPRIAIREILGEAPHRLIATFLEETCLYNRSILHITSGPSCTRNEMLALLSILNSTLGSFFIAFSGRKADRTLFPKIILSDLKCFPVPRRFDQFVDELANISESLLLSGNSTREEELELKVADAFDLTGAEMELMKQLLLAESRSRLAAYSRYQKS